MCHTPVERVRDAKLRKSVANGTLLEANTEFEQAAATHPDPDHVTLEEAPPPPLVAAE